MTKILQFLLLVSTGLATSKYLSPSDLELSSNKQQLYVIEKTAKQLAVFDIESEKVVKLHQLPDEPSGICLGNEKESVFITCGEGFGFLTKINVKSGKLKSYEFGHSPTAPVLSLDKKLLFVANRMRDKISVFDIGAEKVIKSIPVTREPIASVLSKDGKFLYVANHLPTGRADVQRMTSVISIIDTAKLEVVKSIALPNGAIDLRDISVSQDGKWIYVPSIFARFNVPTNQIERGWINTHALNIIDATTQELYHTVLLDDVSLGAANPWGVCSAEDDKYLFVAHNATHEVSVIDKVALFKKLEKAPRRTAGMTLQKYEALKGNPANDLSFIASVRQRVKLEGIGPKGIVSTGKKVFTTQYFSEDIGVVDFEEPDDCFAFSMPLGPKRKMDAIRRGEMYFNDASICFQQWQTCSTCHPDVRTDAVNWDLLNDGIGNPKSTKSLVLSHHTPPAMITGIRANAKVAVRAGIRHIQFIAVDESRARDIDAYLTSLNTTISPYRNRDGSLTDKAKRGAKVFKKAECIRCHNGKYYTDMKKYNVGTAVGSEANKEFDTPTLLETYRTRPYLYNGRAKDMKEVFRKFNKYDQHGLTSELSDKELDELIEFVLSL